MAGQDLAARLNAAITRMASAEAGDRVLRAEVMDVLHRFVSFDAYAFVLTDPVTTVGSSPLADVPDIAALPRLIRLKYLASVNRWTSLPTSGCATLQQATAGRPEQSKLWRDHLADLGILDVASLVFTDRYGCWGFMDLWRRDTYFTEDEIRALARARPAITSRLREAQAAGFTIATSVASERGPSVLVLSPSLNVRAQTPQTLEWLAALVPPQHGQPAVPAGAYNAAAQLLAIEAGIDTHPAQTRVRLDLGTWLTLRAARVVDDHSIADRDIMVTMELSSPAERRDIFSRAHALSSREDVLLRHLAEGGDTRALAAVMSIREHTVQDHLKSVFSKTSTASRRELLAKCSGE